MLYIIGIVITFFLVFLLISKKGKTIADKILAAWLFVIGTHLALYYGYFTSISFQYPFLLGIDAPFPLLHGPFLYLYVVFTTNQFYLKKSLCFLHFLLPLAIFAFFIPFYIRPAAEKIYVYKNQGIGYETLSEVTFAFILISGVVYTVLPLIVLKRYRQALFNQFSNIEKINFNWLKYLVYGLGIVWLVVFSRVPDTILFGVVACYVLFMGYFGIKHVGLFTYTDAFIPPQYETLNKDADSHIKDNSMGNEDDTRKKYQKSGLSEEQADKLQRELSSLMQTEKCYTNSELTLADLALKLNVTPNYLSQVINEKEGVNFYDYVNALRIEAFKKLVTDPKSKNYTLLALAYDCGFNSKTSFNRHFKKYMGQSPSEYTEQLIMLPQPV
jgi:AraC-like DNA-binding protein